MIRGRVWLRGRKRSSRISGFVHPGWAAILDAEVNKRDPLLDGVRGFSALLVMLGHLRSFLFVDYPLLVHPSYLQRAFYFVTGFGHQAVVIFFVLSGYFVGGSVLQSCGAGKFKWRSYAVTRLSRLWTVLVPALVWTCLLDEWGQHLNPQAYLGTLRDQYHSGPSALEAGNHDPTTWLANLFFLQGIVRPEFGTNGPLWSLTNEFWYYTLFPAGLIGFGLLLRRTRNLRGSRSAIGHLTVFILLVSVLPFSLVKAGIIWLLGVAVWRLGHPASTAGNPSTGFGSNDSIQRWSARFVSLLGLVLTLAGARLGKAWGSDLAVGFLFAVCMVAWRDFAPRSQWVRFTCFWSSEISYTLYLFHFPFLFLLCAGFLGGRQWIPSRLGFAVYAGFAGLTLGICAIAWWLFERRTPSVRSFLARSIPPA